MKKFLFLFVTLMCVISCVGYFVIINFNSNIIYGSDLIINKDDYIYYSLSESFMSPSSLIRMKKDKTQREVIYKDGRYFGGLSFIDDNIISIGVSELDLQSNIVNLTLGKKTIDYPVDTTNFYKNSIFLHTYCNGEYYFLVENEENKEKNDLYKKDSNGRYSLLAKEIQLSYHIRGNTIYYLKDNSIFSMNSNGDKVKKILELEDKVYDFNIYNKKVFLQYDSYTSIFDLNTNSNFKFEECNVADIIFNRDDFYCAGSNNGIFKVSYDAKNIIKLTDMPAAGLALIDDWIYFQKPFEYNYDYEYSEPYYEMIHRIRTDGTELELFDYMPLPEI